MNNKISIIMPIYNAEKYLCKTIQSVLEQDYQNWELILIDDCSTDKSKKICESFAKKNKKINLICHDYNQGPSKSRNEALDIATGEWVYFMDADDYIENGAFNIVIDKLIKSKADVCIFGYEQVYENKIGTIKKKVLCEVPIVNSSENIGYVALQLDNAKLFTYVWNKIYRHSIIRENSIYFKDTRMGEDFLFNIDFFYNINKFCFVYKCLYYYRKVEGVTLSNTFCEDYHIISYDRYVKERKLLIKYNALTNENNRILNQINTKHMFSAIVRVVANDNLSKRNKKSYIKSILENKKVYYSLKNHRCKKILFEIIRKILCTQNICLNYFLATLYLRSSGK